MTLSFRLRPRLPLAFAVVAACGSADGPAGQVDASTEPGADARAEVADAGYEVPVFDASESEYDAGPPPEVETRECSAIDRELSEAFSAAWVDPHACTEAAECMLYDLVFRCSGQADGAFFRQCRLAIHDDSVSAVEALVKTVQDEHCGPPTGCFGVSDCGYNSADCVDGMCVPLRSY